MKIFLVAGARPNFMKVAPIAREFDRQGQEYTLVHTGQHYDENMSKVFFKELGIRNPDYLFSINNKSHAYMTADIMMQFEDICIKEKPDLVIVFGDVNSTLACSLVVSKLPNIKLVHIEAGLRSFDRRMPEEINRIVTDILSDYLFVINSESKHYLQLEGIDVSKVFIVGDIMIDTLFYHLKKVIKNPIKTYILMTLHRQSNTDNKEILTRILQSVYEISKENEIIFPIHPRTKKRINEFGLNNLLENITVKPPMSYFEFLYYLVNCKVVITDSGGLQVETTILNIPCITLRENTERGFTLTEGTNILVESDKEIIIKEVNRALKFERKSKLSTENKELFDGNTAKRIVKILLEK